MLGFGGGGGQIGITRHKWIAIFITFGFKISLAIIALRAEKQGNENVRNEYTITIYLFTLQQYNYLT